MVSFDDYIVWLAFAIASTIDGLTLLLGSTQYPFKPFFNVSNFIDSIIVGF